MGGKYRHQALNIFVVWFLTGMWHGASWNFILWGLYFGLFVMVEKYTVLRLKSKAWQPLLHLYSLFVVVVGWTLFYFVDFSQLQSFVPVLFGSAGSSDVFTASNALLSHFWLWVAALLLCLPLRRWIEQGATRRLGAESPLLGIGQLTWRTGLSVGILVLAVALLVGETNNPFLYTRF